MLEISNFIWKTEEDCKNSANKIAASLEGQETIALLGELGAGKTTFVRYLSEALSTMDPVSSPTYVLQQQYRCTDFVIDHWDLYRIKELPEELLESPVNNEIRLIEWADLFPEFEKTLDYKIQIKLELLGEEFIRKVSVTARE